MPRTAKNTVEVRPVYTSYLVLHPDTGLLTTESYEEQAVARGVELIQKYGGKAYIIEAAKIQRVDGDGKLTRFYKLERDRLDIRQELL